MTALRTLGDFYRVKLKTDLAIELQYRGAMLIWLIGAVLEPLIYLLVWSAAANAQGGSIGGLSASDFAAYFIASLLVNQLTFSWVMWEFEEYIRGGELSANLLRPIHPIHIDVCENVAHKALTMVVVVPAIILLSALFKPTWNFELWSLLAFVPAIVLAFALQFLLDWTLALSAFWTTRTESANQLFEAVFLFFSGRLAPLSLFPAALVTISFVLPFRWTLFFPIELILGNLTPSEALWGMAIQLGWIAAALLLMRFVWRIAVRRFSAVGG
jgi:ABC-2 type transport system permease protein